MNLYLRLFLIWMRNRRGVAQHYLHVARSRFRVLPHDLDAFGHMNNGRYLQIMDVARVEWMMQTGVAGEIRRQRWAPLLGGGAMRFRHSLRLLQSYEVRTRLLGWDHRWFYLEHTFVDARLRSVAVGITRAGLRSGGKWVPATTVAEAVYPGATPPAMPDHVRDWAELEEAICLHSTGALDHAEADALRSTH